MPNRLKELRTEKGMTLKEFASSFNSFLADSIDYGDSPKKVSYATISRWENGKPDPSSKYQEPLADYFDVDIGYLLGMTDFKNQSEMDDNAKNLLNFMESRKNIEYDDLELTDDEWQNIIALMGKYRKYTNVQAMDQMIKATIPDDEQGVARKTFISDSKNLNRSLDAITSIEVLFMVKHSNQQKISDIDNYRFEKILSDLRKLAQELQNKYGYNN